MTHAAAVYATLDDWIAHEAFPFSLDSRPDFNVAVDKVIDSLDEEVSLLGFGEALHGGEELLVLRNHLFQRLVEAHGYSAIAIESSFLRGPIVNEYVLGHGPVSYAAVQETGFSHGFGKFETNRELVEWMRHYNADPAHQRKLQFYGFDSPTDMTTESPHPRQILHVALDYLSSVDEATGRVYRNRIDPLLEQDAAWENPAATLDPTQSMGRAPEATALRIETEELISELHVRRPELVAKSDERRYQEAVHYAVMARQLLNFHAALAQTSEKRQAITLGIRAAMMAENLAYILSREQGRGNVLIFAHNSHLKRGKVQWGNEASIWWPVGSHLHEMFGHRYAVIGSAVVSSPANGIGQPEAGTLEARFTSAPGPVRFIPTHLGQGLPASEIAALPIRSGSQKNRSYTEPLNAQSFSDFDWFAVLDTTAYNGWGHF
jgi:erythromycin esterase-like protein